MSLFHVIKYSNINLDSEAELNTLPKYIRRKYEDFALVSDKIKSLDEEANMMYGKLGMAWVEVNEWYELESYEVYRRHLLAILTKYNGKES